MLCFCAAGDLFGRYASSLLKATHTYPPVEYRLHDSGVMLDAAVETMFAPMDPFATGTTTLCQQITWNMQDLEPHCDRDRPDKDSTPQPAGMDGAGDRITALTLRQPCWLLMRRTRDQRQCFAVRLQPGDLYSIAGPARWHWQHAIYIDNPPPSFAEARISVVWRMLEQYPD